MSNGRGRDTPSKYQVNSRPFETKRITSPCFTLTHFVPPVMSMVRPATAVTIVRTAEAGCTGSPRRSVRIVAAPADRLAAESVTAKRLEGSEERRVGKE